MKSAGVQQRRVVAAAAYAHLKRKAGGHYFSALMVTDITELSSILLIELVEKTIGG